MMTDLIYLQHIDAAFLKPLFNKVVPLGKPGIDTNSNPVFLFGGGTDVSPDLYNEKISPFSDCPDSRRDKLEAKIYELCLQKKIPMIGICRGSQFLTVMNGGALIQHVSNHAGPTHEIKDDMNNVIVANSYHHQMMFPWRSNKPFKVIASANPRKSTLYLGQNGTNFFDDYGYTKSWIEKEFTEPEIVWWPESKCLCIQGHPEWSKEGGEYQQYVFELIKKYIFLEK